jgi:hypothetical protein
MPRARRIAGPRPCATKSLAFQTAVFWHTVVPAKGAGRRPWKGRGRGSPNSLLAYRTPRRSTFPFRTWTSTGWPVCTLNQSTAVPTVPRRRSRETRNPESENATNRDGSRSSINRTTPIETRRKVAVLPSTEARVPLPQPEIESTNTHPTLRATRQ